MRGSMFMLLLGAGCAVEKGPDDPHRPPAAAAACEADDECGFGEICEEATCVEGDRDDSFDGANPILQNEPREGVIVPAGDVDTWVYTSLGPEWLRIQTVTEADDPVENLNTVVQVFAANGAEHAVMDDYPTGNVTTYDTVLYVYLPRADTWYVTVEDVTTHYPVFAEADQRGGSDFVYTLEILPFNGLTQDPDASDDPSSRLELTSGTTTWAVGVNLEDPGDSDWISVTLPEGGQPLDVFGAEIPGTSARPRVRLYEPGGALVLEKDDLGAEGQASYFDPAPGSWTLEATDAAGGGGPDAWYVVYVRTYEEGGYHPFFGTSVYEEEVEPNDTDLQPSPHTVQQIPLDNLVYGAQLVQGRFDDPGDEDWYEIDAAPGEKITARCWTHEFGSLTSLEAALFSNGTDITPPDQGEVPTPLSHYLHNVEVPAPGAYGIRLRSADAASGPGAYYRCRLLQATFDFATE